MALDLVGFVKRSGENATCLACGSDKVDFAFGPYGASLFCRRCGQNEIRSMLSGIEIIPGNKVPRVYSTDVSVILLNEYGMTLSQADVYQLVVLCGQKVSEAAQFLGVKPQSVQTILKTARTKVNNAQSAP